MPRARSRPAFALALGMLLALGACTGEDPHPRRAPPPSPSEPGIYNDSVLSALGRCDTGEPLRPLAGGAVCDCNRAAGSPGLPSVALSLAIGEEGRVLRVAATPESPFASCLQSALPNTFVPAPPSLPWMITVKTLMPGTVLTH